MCYIANRIAFIGSYVHLFGSFLDPFTVTAMLNVFNCLLGFTRTILLQDEGMERSVYHVGMIYTQSFIILRMDIYIYKSNFFKLY